MVVNQMSFIYGNKSQVNFNKKSTYSTWFKSDDCILALRFHYWTNFRVKERAPVIFVEIFYVDFCSA